MDIKEEYTSLKELAKELKINKSRLNYYVWLDLFSPVMEVGKTMVFNRKQVKEAIEYIEERRGKGETLKEISKKLRLKT